MQQLELVPARRPNVIWFVTDQMRAQAMSFTGDPNVRTPNLDNLAREGIHFCNAVAGSPWCCPFRGALLTGMYPHNNGVTQTPGALDPGLATIAQPLRQAGYHTAWVGKWHLDGSNSVTHYVPPTNRGGFDYWMGYENNNNQNESYIYGTESETPVRLTGYETDSLTDLLIRHVREHVGKGDDYQPFFAALSVQPPHSPYVAPTTPENPGRYFHHPDSLTLRHNVPGGNWEKEARMDLAGYYGMIENIDDNLGKLRMALKEMGIDRETYIVFFSDHGDCLGSHAQWEKSTPWEEAIRIPFIVGRVGGNYHMRQGVNTSTLNHVDIAPTTLGLCGIEKPESMVGYDYSHLLMQRSDPMFFGDRNDCPAPRSAYLQQIPRKFHPHSVNKPWRGVVTADGWKYVCMPGFDWLLFNLNEDPYEEANLCYDTVFQEKKEELHALLAEWIERTGDSFALPDIGLGEAGERFKALASLYR